MGSRPCNGALAVRQQALAVLETGRVAFTAQAGMLPGHPLERAKCEAAAEALDITRSTLATVWAQMDAKIAAPPARGEA